MIVVLCEGSRDLEFLAHLFESKGFNKVNHDEDYVYKKLGLERKKYCKVLRKNDNELLIFYPESGSYELVLKTAKDSSTQIAWKNRGVTKVALAVDLDDKNVEERITAIERSLRGVYEVNRLNRFSFSCKYNAYEFLFTIIPVGDSSLQKKIDINQEKCMIEDLILNLALTKHEYKNILQQSIELYEHKMNKKPSQKALLRMIESFCNKPESGSYEIISELKDNIPTILPEQITESITEIIN